jgi:hypothetical protein
VFCVLVKSSGVVRPQAATESLNAFVLVLRSCILWCVLKPVPLCMVSMRHENDNSDTKMTL